MQIVVTNAQVRLGGRVVLSGVSAVFAAEQVTALVGPSGSGKSTLLAAMAGYQPLDSGEVRHEDTQGCHPPSPDNVAWVPQGNNVLPGRSAVDNVMVAALSAGCGVQEATSRAMFALEQVGLIDRRNQTAKQMSGGELQRVSFARALASNKPMIFADEPSASLDSRNTERIAELLAGLRSQATVVVATHDPILVRAAAAVVALREG